MSLRRSFAFSLAFLFLGVLDWPPASLGLSAEERPLTEYQIKAEFIYHLLQFVEWPSRVKTESDLQLLILGEDPFGDSFVPYQGKRIRERRWQVRKIQSRQDLRRGHVLFICASERYRLPQILTQAHRLGMLTLGDTEDFGRQGVMVNLFLEQNRVHFEINLDSARESGIVFSSHVLKLARIVRQRP